MLEGIQIVTYAVFLSEMDVMGKYQAIKSVKTILTFLYYSNQDF